jgi:hypothetical protein
MPITISCLVLWIDTVARKLDVRITVTVYFPYNAFVAFLQIHGILRVIGSTRSDHFNRIFDC